MSMSLPWAWGSRFIRCWKAMDRFTSCHLAPLQIWEANCCWCHPQTILQLLLAIWCSSNVQNSLLSGRMGGIWTLDRVSFSRQLPHVHIAIVSWTWRVSLSLSHDQVPPIEIGNRKQNLMFLSYWGILAPICDNEGCGFPRWIPVAVWHASHGLQLEDALIRNGNDEDLIKEMHQQLGVASEIDGFSPQIVLLFHLSCHLSCISQPGSSGFPLKKWRPTFLPDGFGGCFHLVAITSPAGWYPRFHHPTSYVSDDDDDDNGWPSSFSLVICYKKLVNHWWYPQLSSSSIPDTHMSSVQNPCWCLLVDDYRGLYYPVH